MTPDTPKGRVVMRLSKHEYLTCLYILGDMWTTKPAAGWHVTSAPVFEPTNMRAYYLAQRYQMARFALAGAL